MWIGIAIAAGSLLCAAAGVLYFRGRILRLVDSAATLARSEADLEYRQRVGKESSARHEVDSVAEVRQHELNLLEEVTRDDERVDLVDRINSGGI